jgi:hypothetical protein
LFLAQGLQGFQDLILALEVPVNGTGTQAKALRDIAHGSFVVALLRKAFPCSHEDLLSSQLKIFIGHFRSHGDLTSIMNVYSL